MQHVWKFVRRHLVAEAAPMSAGELIRSAIAGLIGFLLYQWILYVLPVAPDSKQILVPLGATCMILFMLPHSPLAQPWSVFGGLFISAMVGFACGYWIDSALIAYAVAVSLSIAATANCRCVHPPAGAMSLTMAMAAHQGADPYLSLSAVLFNILAILVAVLAINNIVPGRRYPQCAPPVSEHKQALDSTGIEQVDLQAALTEMDTYLDISGEDLVDVFSRATRNAMQRNLRLLCRDVMRTDIPSISATTSLNEAWRLMQRHRYRALPVVDKDGRVIGILDSEDFLWHIEPLPNRAFRDNVRELLRIAPSKRAHDSVERIMRTTGEDELTVQADEPIVAAIDRIAGHDQMLVPVVNQDNRLLGVMMLPDLLQILRHRTALELPAVTANDPAWALRA